MKIPVIVMLPAQEPLRESAFMAAQRRSHLLDIQRLQHHPMLELDQKFAAIPLSTGLAATASLESMQPDTSNTFAVRGFIDDQDLDKVADPLPDGSRVFANPEIAPFPTCPNSGAVGTDQDVAFKLQLAALHSRGLNGADVAIAVCDTGINLAFLKARLQRPVLFDAGNSWSNPNLQPPVQPGQHAVDHGTMCAYDALIGAPQCTLLDYPVLAGQTQAGAVIARSLSTAVQAYANLLAFWAVAFAPGGALRYKALVVNNSWGMYHPSWDFPKGHPGRYSDNPNHVFNILVSTLARNGADILFAAGNCGSACPAGQCQGVVKDTIRGANAHPDVLTLGGVDTKDQWVGYSSQGPGIAGMAQSKPDLAAYTHFLGSTSSGPQAPDTGTSASCPVAAGCVAALRSATRYPPAVLPPTKLFAQLRSTARQISGTAAGWNTDTGFGIIDPQSAALSLGI